MFMSVHGEDQQRQADELALRAYKRLLNHLRDGDSAGAAETWRRHQEGRAVHGRRLRHHPGGTAVLSGHTVLSATSLSICSSDMPSSVASTSRVCCPSVGGGA